MVELQPQHSINNIMNKCRFSKELTINIVRINHCDEHSFILEKVK